MPHCVSFVVFLGIFSMSLCEIKTPQMCGQGKSADNEENSDGPYTMMMGGVTVPSEHVFPWVGYLVFGVPENRAICTISLYQPKWFITAAHCVTVHKNCSSPAYAIFGVVNIHNRKPENTFKVVRFYHPSALQIVEYSLINDIAIGELQSEVDVDSFKGKVGLICLPKRIHDIRGHIYLAGWGYTSQDALHTSDTLQFLSARLALNEECSLKATKFCVEGEKTHADQLKSTGAGDSGGPAMTKKKDGTFVISGVLSSKIDVRFALYTPVNVYINWIRTLDPNKTVVHQCKLIT